MEFKEQQPIYLQIAHYVCEMILTRAWPENERIPSVRELAVQLEVNPNTVMRTYEFLQQKQIVYNQRGVGLFVSERGITNATEYRRTEFLKKEVPVFLKTMSLLQITMEDLETIARRLKKTKTV